MCACVWPCPQSITLYVCAACVWHVRNQSPFMYFDVWRMCSHQLVKRQRDVYVACPQSITLYVCACWRCVWHVCNQSPFKCVYVRVFGCVAMCVTMFSPNDKLLKGCVWPCPQSITLYVCGHVCNQSPFMCVAMSAINHPLCISTCVLTNW